MFTAEKKIRIHLDLEKAYATEVYYIDTSSCASRTEICKGNEIFVMALFQRECEGNTSPIVMLLEIPRGGLHASLNFSECFLVLPKFFRSFFKDIHVRELKPQTDNREADFSRADNSLGFFHLSLHSQPQRPPSPETLYGCAHLPIPRATLKS